MKYILIYDYSKKPTLIYDGGEPKNINYKILDGTSKLLCKIDLWEKKKNLLSDDKFGKNKISDIIGMRRKIIPGTDLEIIVIPVDGEDSFVRFASCSNVQNFQEQIIVCYCLFEKQPGRYQCYVVAVLKAVRDNTNV